MLREKKPLLCLLLPFLLGGCLNLKQPANTTCYYTLEYAQPRITGLEPLRSVLMIRRLNVAPQYNTHQILYREKAYNRQAYAYHKWRSNPGDMVTGFLLRYMRESDLFTAVADQSSRLSAAYILEGTIEEFLEHDLPDGWHAVLAVHITLIDTQKQDAVSQVLLQKRYRATAPCRSKNPRALAGAMSSATADISEKIIRDIYACINTGRMGKSVSE